MDNKNIRIMVAIMVKMQWREFVPSASILRYLILKVFPINSQYMVYRRHLITFV